MEVLFGKIIVIIIITIIEKGFGMFVNRVSELALLEKHYTSKHAELFVLYGRRRVGKTELLAHFCEGKPHVFFVADQVSEQVLRENFSAVMNEAVFGPD